jgi:hypothetical protein
MTERDKFLDSDSEINFAVDDEDDEDEDDELLPEEPPPSFAGGYRSRSRFEARAAERLSIRLLAVPDDDSDEEDRIVRESLRLVGPTTTSSTSQLMNASSFYGQSAVTPPVAATPLIGMRQSQSTMTLRTSTSLVSLSTRRSLSSGKLDALLFMEQAQPAHKKAERGIYFMATVAVSLLVLVIAASAIGVAFVGPPNRKY